MNSPIEIFLVVTYKAGVRWIYARKTSQAKALEALAKLKAESPFLTLSIEARVEHGRL